MHVFLSEKDTMSKQQQDDTYSVSQFSRFTRVMALFTASLFLVSSNLALPAQASALDQAARAEMTRQEWRQFRQNNRMNGLPGRGERAPFFSTMPIQQVPAVNAEPIMPQIIIHPDAPTTAGGNITITPTINTSSSGVVNVNAGSVNTINTGAISVRGGGLTAAQRAERREARAERKAERLENRAARNEVRNATPQTASTPKVRGENRINRAERIQAHKDSKLSSFVTQLVDGNLIKLDNGGHLDLTAGARNITIGDKLIPAGASVTIKVGGETKTVTTGSQVSAAEYVAVKQVLVGGKQELTVDANGIATGGNVDLSQVSATRNTMKADGLTVASGVTAVGDLAKNSSFRLSGDLNNYGSVYAVASEKGRYAGEIHAENITNNEGALISSDAGNKLGNRASAIDLSLTATNKLTNLGTIESSGDLNLTAGGGINNSGNTTARDNLSLNSSEITNTGALVSTKGNVNLDSPVGTVMNVNNEGGKLQALKGDINVRTAGNVDGLDANIIGGDLLSKNLNINAGQGLTTVDVKELTGVVKAEGYGTHVTASTSNLNLGAICMTGDPTFYNNAGNININANISVSEALSIISSGDIIIAGGVNSITARTAGGLGQQINLVAGAQIDDSGLAETSTTLPGGTPITGSIEVTGPSTTGGSITGGAANLVIDSSGTGTNNAGGDINLIAFAADPGTGNIILGNNSVLNSSASGTGAAAGSINVSAGGDIALGSITADGQNNTGNILVRNANATGSVTYNQFGQANTSYGFGGTLTGGLILIGSVNSTGTETINAGAGGLSFNAAHSAFGAVSITSNAGITSGGNPFSVTSTGSSINISALGTISTSAQSLDIDSASTAVISASDISTADGAIDITGDGAVDVTTTGAGGISSGAGTINIDSTNSTTTVTLGAGSMTTNGASINIGNATTGQGATVSGTSITTTGGDVSVLAAAGTASVTLSSDISTGAGSIDVDSDGMGATLTAANVTTTSGSITVSGNNGASGITATGGGAISTGTGSISVSSAAATEDTSITAGSLSTSGGNISATSARDVLINLGTGTISSGGGSIGVVANENVTITASSIDAGTGSFSVISNGDGNFSTTASAISADSFTVDLGTGDFAKTGGGNLAITTDAYSTTVDTFSVGGGTLTIDTLTTGTTIGLNGGAGTLIIDSVELEDIIATTLIIGSTTSGAITTAGTLDISGSPGLTPGAYNLTLTSNDAITGGADFVLGNNNLTATTDAVTGAIALGDITGGTGTSTIVLQAGTGGVVVGNLENNTGSINIDAVGGSVNTGSVTKNGGNAFTADGTSITVSGAISTDTANVVLNASNSVSTQTITTTAGNILIDGTSGTVSVGAITTAGDVDIDAGTTISGASIASTGGGNVLLSSGTNTTLTGEVTGNAQVVSIATGAGGIISTQSITNAGPLNLGTTGNTDSITTQALNATTGAIQLEATGAITTTTITTSGAVIANGGDIQYSTISGPASSVTLNATSGDITGGAITASGGVDLDATTFIATGAISGVNVAADAAGQISIASINSAGTVDLDSSADSVVVSGAIAATGLVDIDAGTTVNTGSITTTGAVNVDGVGNVVIGGNISGPTASVVINSTSGAISTGTINSAGLIDVGGATTTSVQTQALTAGAAGIDIDTAGQADIASATTTGALNILAGTNIVVPGAISADLGASLTGTAGLINVTGNITTTSGGITANAGGSTVTLANLQTSGGSVDVDAATSVQVGTVTAGAGNINVDAGTSSSLGVLTNTGTIAVNSGTTATIAGINNAAGSSVFPGPFQVSIVSGNSTTLTGDINGGTGNILLEGTTGDVTLQNATLTTGTLVIVAGNNTTVSTITTTTGNIDIDSGNDTTITTVTTTGGMLNVNSGGQTDIGTINIGGNVLLISDGDIDIGTTTTAGDIFLYSGADINVLGTLTADPIVMTALGNVNLGGSLVADDGITVVAGQNIQNTVGAITINGNGATDGGNITMVAGADFTEVPMTNVTINGASVTGGSILLTNVAGFGNITANGDAGTGGDITLSAFSNGFTGGQVLLPVTSAIVTTGSGTNASGDVTVVAGAVTGQAIQIGSITQSTATDGTAASTVIQAATPQSGQVISNDASYTGAFQGGALTAADIRIGNITNRAGDVSVSGLGNVGLGIVNVSGRTAEAGGSINISANGTDVFDIGVLAGANFAQGLLANGGTTSGAGGGISVTNLGTTGIRTVNGLSITTVNGDGGELSLNADQGNITLAAGTYSVNGNGAGNDAGDISLTAAGILVTGGSAALQSLAGAGGLGGTVTVLSTGASDLTLGTSAGQLTIAATGTGSDVDVTTGGNLTLANTTALNADSVSLSTTLAGSDLTINGTITSVDSVFLNSADAIAVNNTVTGTNSVSANANGNINGSGSLNSTLVALTSTGGNIGTSAASRLNIAAVNLGANAQAGSVFLNDTTGDLDIVQDSSAANTFDVQTAGALSNILGATVTANNVVLRSTGSTVTLNDVVTGTTSATIRGNGTITTAGSGQVVGGTVNLTSDAASVGTSNVSRFLVDANNLVVTAASGSAFVFDANSVNIGPGASLVGATYDLFAGGDISSSGTLVGNNIVLAASSSFLLGSAITGNSSISLTSANSITNTNLSGATLTTPQLTLESTAGSIGSSSASRLNVDAINLTASAAGGVFISDANDVTITGTNTSNGNFDVVAANNLTTAVASVISSTAGSVLLRATAGSLNIGGSIAANAVGQSVTLRSGQSILNGQIGATFTTPTLNLISDNGNIGASTASRFNIGLGVANVTANAAAGSVFLTTASNVNLGGGASSALNTFDVLGTGLGTDITTTGTITAANVVLAAPDDLTIGGDITATGDVSLTAGNDIATTAAVSGNNVSYVASNGGVALGGLTTGATSISVSSNDSIINANIAGGLVAPQITLNTANDVGVDAGTRLNINATNLTVNAGGAVFIADTAGGVNFTGANTSTGEFDVTANGDISNSGTLTTGDLTLTATGAGSDITVNNLVNATGTLTFIANASGGQIAVNANVTATSDIVMSADSNLTTGVGASVANNGDINLSSANGNIGTSAASRFVVNAANLQAAAPNGSVWIEDVNAVTIANLTGLSVAGQTFDVLANGNLTVDGATSVSASDVVLRAGGATGVLALNGPVTGTTSVTLRAAGNIAPGSLGGAANVVAPQINLISDNGSIGTSAINRLVIDAGNLTANAAGDVYIDDTIGGVNIGAGSSSAGGSFDVAATAGDLTTTGTITATHVVLESVLGNTTVGGGITATGLVQVAAQLDVTVDAAITGGNVQLISQTGGVQINQLVTGTSIALVNSQDSITNASLAGGITAPTIILISDNDIGTAGNRLLIDAVNLSLNAQNDVFVTDSNSVNLLSSTAGGTFDVLATNDLTSTGAISGDDVVLRAQTGALGLGANVNGTTSVTLRSNLGITNLNFTTITTGAGGTINLVSDSGDIGTSPTSRLTIDADNLTANAANGSVYIFDTDSVNLGAGSSSAANNFDVVAAQDITNSGIVAANNVSLRATAGSITLGALVTGVTSVSLRSGGSITDGAVVNVVSDQINLTSDNGDIGTLVNPLNIDALNLTANAFAGNVFVNDANTITIGAGSSSALNTFSVTAGLNLFTTGTVLGQDVILTATNGSLFVGAQITGAASISLTQALTMTNANIAAPLVAPQINLTSTAGSIGTGTFNRLALDAASISFNAAGSVFFSDPNTVNVSSATATGTIDILANNDLSTSGAVTGGNIVLTSTVGDVTTNGTTTSSGPVTVNAAENININGAVSGTVLAFTATDNVNVNAAVVGSTSATIDAGEDVNVSASGSITAPVVVINAGDDIDLDGNVAGATSVTLNAGDTITQDIASVIGGGALSVTFVNGPVTLNTAVTSLTSNAAGQTLTINEANGISLLAQNLDNLTVNAAQTGAGNLTVDTALDLVSLTLTTGAGSGDVVFNVDTTTSGDTTVTSSGTITQNTGVITADVLNANWQAGNVLLSTDINTLNSFANGNSLTVFEANSITLGTILATQDLFIIANGSVTTTNSITIGGVVVLEANAGDIVLNNNLIAGDDVTLYATGAITQNAGSVNGDNLTITWTTGDVTLTTNIVSLDSNGSGLALTINEANGIILNSQNVSDLTINAGLIGAGDIALSTALNLTGGLDLDNNNGNIILGTNDVDALNASLVASGTITQDNANNIDTGSLFLGFGSGPVTLNTVIDFLEVDAPGQTLILDQTGDIVLGAIDLASLTIFAHSDIETTLDFTVVDLDLEADGGSIILNSNVNVTGVGSLVADDTITQGASYTLGGEGIISLEWANDDVALNTQVATLTAAGGTNGLTINEQTGIAFNALVLGSLTVNAGLSLLGGDIDFNVAANIPTITATTDGNININASLTSTTSASFTASGDITQAALTTITTPVLTVGNTGLSTGTISITGTTNNGFGQSITVVGLSDATIVTNELGAVNLQTSTANSLSIDAANSAIFTFAGDTTVATTLSVTTTSVLNENTQTATTINIQSATGSLFIDGGAGGNWIAFAGGTNFTAGLGGDLTLYGVQNITGVAEFTVDPFQAITIDAGAVITGDSSVTLNTCTLNLNGILIGDPVIFNCPLGAGTIANSNGDVVLTSDIIFNGLDFAIIASGSIIEAGITQIDLSSAAADGGSLTLLAGFDFTPATAGQVGPNNILYTITGNSVTGGSINLGSTNINTSSTTLVGDGGSVFAVASGGSVTLNNVDTSSALGAGGNVTVIGETGITVNGNISTLALGSGDVTLAVGTSVVNGQVLIGNGEMFGTGSIDFGAQTAGNILVSGSLNAGDGNVNLTGALGAADTIQTIGPLTADTLNILAGDGSTTVSFSNIANLNSTSNGNVSIVSNGVDLDIDSVTGANQSLVVTNVGTINFNSAASINSLVLTQISGGAEGISINAAITAIDSIAVTSFGANDLTVSGALTAGAGGISLAQNGIADILINDDLSTLGGGNIAIVSADAVSVLAGTAINSTGDLLVLANGDVLFGAGSTIGTAGDATFESFTADVNFGLGTTISSGGAVHITADLNVITGGDIVSTTVTNINATTGLVSLNGPLTGLGDVNVTANTDVIFSSGTSSIGTLGNVTVTAGDEIILSSGDADINATDVTLNAVTIDAAGTESLTVNATSDVVVNSDITILGTLTLNGESVTIDGLTDADAGINIASTVAGFTTNGDIISVGDISITTNELTNENLISGNNVNIQSYTGGVTVNGGLTGGEIAATGVINVTGTAGDATFLGDQLFTAPNTAFTSATNFAVVIGTGALIDVTGTLDLNTCNLVLLGTLNAPVINFNCPLGAGTIANSIGDVDLSGVGVLNFNGLDLAILASGNVLANGNTTINLSSATNDGGDLLVVAGFDFTPATGGQLNFTPLLFTITGANATGGNIDFTGLSINTGSTFAGGNGGNVILVANGGITNAGTITTEAITTTGDNNGGAVTIIGESDIDLNGAVTTTGTNGVGGDITVAVAQPILAPGPSTQVGNGELLQGGFAVGTASAGTLTATNLNAGSGDIAITSSNGLLNTTIISNMTANAVSFSIGDGTAIVSTSDINELNLFSNGTGQGFLGVVDNSGDLLLTANAGSARVNATLATSGTFTVGTGDHTYGAITVSGDSVTVDGNIDANSLVNIYSDAVVSGDITVNGSITSTSAVNMEVLGAGNIDINGEVTGTNVTFNLATATDNISIDAAVIATAVTGNINFNLAGGNVTQAAEIAAANVNLNGTAGQVFLTNLLNNVDALNVNTIGSGEIAFNNVGDLALNVVANATQDLSVSTTGTLDLQSAIVANELILVGGGTGLVVDQTITATAGASIIVDAGELTIDQTITAGTDLFLYTTGLNGDIFVNADISAANTSVVTAINGDGNITIDANVTGTTAITIDADGGITQTSGTISGGALGVAFLTGNTVLTTNVDSLASTVTGASLTVNEADAITLLGNTGNDLTVNTTNGSITTTTPLNYTNLSFNAGGAGSDLVLGADVTGTATITLVADNAIVPAIGTVINGGDLTLIFGNVGPTFLGTNVSSLTTVNTGGTLTIINDGDIVLHDQDVANLSVSTFDGDIETAEALTMTSLELVAGGSGEVLINGGAVNVTTLTVSTANGIVSQNATSPITASTFNLTVNGVLADLDAVANAIGTLNGSGTGSIFLDNGTTALSVASLGATQSLNASTTGTGSIAFTGNINTTGDITLTTDTLSNDGFTVQANLINVFSNLGQGLVVNGGIGANVAQFGATNGVNFAATLDNLVMNGNTTFTSIASLSALFGTDMIVISTGADVFGQQELTVNTCNLILQGTLQGSPLVWNNPCGNGTIANSTGDVNLLGNIIYNGQDLAIIASGNINAAGATLIDLTNSAGNGGNLTMLAGYDFTPATPGQVTNGNVNYAISGYSTSGGSINLGTLNIVTNGSAGSNGGNVVAVANGGSLNAGWVDLGNVTSNGEVGGNLQVIAESFVALGDVDLTGVTAGGNATINTGTPSNGVGVTILNGVVSGPAFTAGANNGGSILVDSITTNGTGDVTLTGNLSTTSGTVTGDVVTLNSSADIGADTNDRFTINAGTVTGTAAGSAFIRNLNTAASTLGALTVAAGQTLDAYFTGDLNTAAQTAGVIELRTEGAFNVTGVLNGSTSIGLTSATDLTNTQVAAANLTTPILNLRTSNNADIGSTVTAFQVGAGVGEIRINTAELGGASAYVSSAATGGVNLGTSVATNDLFFSAAGPLTVIGDLTNVDGNINVTAGSGTLRVDDGVTIQANSPGSNGNVFIGNAINGGNKKTTFIEFGDGSSIIGNAAVKPGGNVTIQMGELTTRVRDLTNPPRNVTYTEIGTGNIQGGKSAKPFYAGKNGDPQNTITADNAIVFISNTMKNKNIVLEGNVNITADPPASATAMSAYLPNGGSFETVTDKANAGATSIATSNTESAIANTMLNTMFNSNTGIIANTAIGTDLNNATTAGFGSNAGSTVTGKDVTLSGGVSAIGEDNSYMVGGYGPTAQADASICSDIELGAGNEVARTAHSNRVVIKKGNVLFVPFQDTVVETPHGNVSIEAKSVALVSVHGDKLAVYDLEDSHKGSVTVNAHGKQIALAPGNHVTVAHEAAGEFAQVNAIEAIPHRNLATKTIKAGIKAHTSEFSVASAIQSVKPLQAVMSSKHPQAKQVANKMMKTTAILLHMGGNGGDFQHYFKPAMTAMK